MDKLWYRHTMKYYPAKSKSERDATWMNFIDIMLSEKNPERNYSINI